MVNRRGFVWFGTAVALFAGGAWSGSSFGGSLWAQSADATTNIMGTVAAVHGKDIEVDTGQGKVTVRTNSATRIWRGEDGRSVDVLRVGDEVTATGVSASQGMLLASGISTNITKLDGIIRGVSGDDVEVEAVRNDLVPETRRVRLTGKTLGSKTLLLKPEDVQVGRNVMVIGLALEDGSIQAYRFVVYVNGRAVDSPTTKYRDPYTGKIIDKP